MRLGSDRPNRHFLSDNRLLNLFCVHYVKGGLPVFSFAVPGCVSRQSSRVGGPAPC